ncbi:Inhibin beta B chain-like protein [Dinothrombium tinctorium]|uniref:Inhibin beta B chain-like protein n=1 Tax=Dinothrombium tinctorium TaxID=1965070 RepID=A0A443QRS8_9ACAR|nr:Inhibin beta B chain-like protein [Dinothrombium tinctorium]
MEANDTQNSESKLTFENDSLQVAECINCSQPNEEIVKQLKIEAIKQRILSALKLKTKPKFNSSIPREQIEETLRKALSSDENKNENIGDAWESSQNSSLHEKYYDKTSKIILFSKAASDVGHIVLNDAIIKTSESLNGKTVIEFSVDNQEMLSLEETEAELLVYLQVPANNDLALRERNLTLNVFRVKKGWKRVDLSVPFQLWFSDSQFSKLSVLIECEGCDSLVRILLSNNDSADGYFNITELTKNNHHLIDEEDNYKKSRDKGVYVPFLVIKTKSKVKQKFKRQTTNCDNKKECCKQELYISFNEIGLDDVIIAPNGFYANYCSGKCSNLSPNKVPNAHSNVLDNYRKIITPSTSAALCCAPTSYSAMSIIYQDSSQNVVKWDAPNIIVETCGCI